MTNVTNMSEKEFENFERAKRNIFRATPFLGSDESWEHQHGENWREVRASYIAECKRRKQKLIAKIISKNNVL